MSNSIEIEIGISILFSLLIYFFILNSIGILTFLLILIIMGNIH